MITTHEKIDIVHVRFSENELERLNRNEHLDFPQMEMDNLKESTKIIFEGPGYNG